MVGAQWIRFLTTNWCTRESLEPVNAVHWARCTNFEYSLKYSPKLGHCGRCGPTMCGKEFDGRLFNFLKFNLLNSFYKTLYFLNSKTHFKCSKYSSPSRGCVMQTGSWTVNPAASLYCVVNAYYAYTRSIPSWWNCLAIEASDSNDYPNSLRRRVFMVYAVRVLRSSRIYDLKEPPKESHKMSH